MKKESLFYTPSMRVNPIGLAISYCLSIIIALGLGYFYSIVLLFMPIVYINFLMTLGLGLSLGITNRVLTRLSHNRNKKSQWIQAISLGILANFFQWTVCILYVFSGKIPSIWQTILFTPWTINPINFFTVLAEINVNGMWTFMGGPIHGFLLALVWIIEAIAILFLTILPVYKVKTYPYSETRKKWYPKYTLLQDFESIAAINLLYEALKSDPLKALKGLGLGTSYRHTKVHVFYLEEVENQYLTIERVFMEGKGKGSKRTDIIINNYTLNKITAKSILNQFKNKRERIEII